MEHERSHLLWLTDTHIWRKHAFLEAITKEDPTAILHSGDLTDGFLLEGVLDFLGARLPCPIYYVGGNHELFGSDIETTHALFRSMGAKYPNLIWATERGIIPLNETTALIAHEGWYDCLFGNEDCIRLTFDWFMVKDFRVLPGMNSRIEMFRAMAKESAEVLSTRLEEALATYETVYLISHIPAWVEAAKAMGNFVFKIWGLYNTNWILGQELERVMAKHPTKKLISLFGHSHHPLTFNPASNIECRVGAHGFKHIAAFNRIYI